ncbi:MAG: bis(5'-nucleosyl)-tetraphosphatase (symmetrical) YqeK [bacterium]
MKEADLLLEVKKKLPKKRYLHTLAVADTAEEIAIQQGYSRKKARLAALLHDYAKFISLTELRNIAEIVIDEWEIGKEELDIPHLLHAPVAAYLAKNQLAVDDYDVLEAIRYHTIGNPGMGKLAQIIFVADFIEPNRNFVDLDIIKKELEKDIEKAIVLICNYSIKYNIDKNRIIHPNTLNLRNAYLRRQH